jgi:FkbM family methyltransferase
MKKISEYSDYDISSLDLTIHEGFSMLTSKRLSGLYAPDKFERFTSDLIRGYLMEGMTFIDIGSHHGFYTLLASGRVGATGRVVSIDPVKENLAILSKNLLNNDFKNAQVINAAISDSSGTNVFSITEASDSCCFGGHPNTPTIEEREVLTLTLDEICHGDKIDVVKIDTEGHEGFVFRGMKNVILNNPDIKIFLEFNPDCIRFLGQKPSSLLKELVECGLDVFFIRDSDRRLFQYNAQDPEGFVNILSADSYVNLLCMKKGSVTFIQLFSHSSEIEGAELSLLEDTDSLLQRNYLFHITLPSKGPLFDKLVTRTVSLDIQPLCRWTKDAVNQKHDFFVQLCEAMPGIISNSLLINPHLIITNTSVIPQGAITSLMINKPHIWNITEFGLPEYGIEFLFEENIRKEFIADSSSMLLFASSALKDSYSSFITATSPWKTIYPKIRNRRSVEVQEGSSAGDGKVKIIYPAYLIEGKRQDELIEAVYLLKSRGYDNLEVMLIGNIASGKYVEKLEESIIQKKLELLVKFKPYVADNLWQVYSDAEIVISCSRMEGFGRILSEGMAHGKFVIGARSGATPEIIDHMYNGLLYEPGNAEDLAEKIIQFLDKKIDIKTILQKALESSVKFTITEPYRDDLSSSYSEAITSFEENRDVAPRSLLKNSFYLAFINSLVTEKFALSKENSVLANKNSLLMSQNSSLEVRDKEMQERIEQISNSRIDVIEELFLTKKALDRERADNEAIKKSITWRVSGPVRRFFDFLRVKV